MYRLMWFEKKYRPKVSNRMRHFRILYAVGNILIRQIEEDYLLVTANKSGSKSSTGNVAYVVRNNVLRQNYHILRAEYICKWRKNYIFTIIYFS